MFNPIGKVELFPCSQLNLSILQQGTDQTLNKVKYDWREVLDPKTDSKAALYLVELSKIHP
jgi:hypothetical protein